MNFKSLLNIIVEFLLCINLSIFLMGGFPSTTQAAAVDIDEGSEWDYFKGTKQPPYKQPPYKWSHIGFEGFDENWFRGRTGIGYGHPNKVVTKLDDMKGSYQTVYARREITLNESSYRLLQQDSTKITLSIICDGSFKAWLNGTELIRSNDMRKVSNERLSQTLDIDITAFARELFLKGSNVLAIQCSNDDIASDNFLFIPTLQMIGE